jgi:VCBS repeat-containing protein
MLPAETVRHQGRHFVAGPLFSRNVCMKKVSQKHRRGQQVRNGQDVNRRNFLRLESLEPRLALAAAVTAINDAFQTGIDQPLDSGSPGVLMNDISTTGQALSATVFSCPANGQVEFHSDGSFLYTPNPGFEGQDSFVYSASDGVANSLLAAVTIQVADVNELPVAANDDFTLDENQTLTTTTSVLANDSDPEGSPLTPQLASQPQHGSVTLNPDGTFTYQPEANFHGLDGFSYLVSDGTEVSAVATVTISVNAVNDLPVATNDEYTLDEDAVLNVAATGLLGNDSDSDGDPLTATLVAGPQHGTVTLNADGSFIYTPAADFNGVDGFSYQAGDGTASSDVASVTINLTPVNDAPASAADAYEIAEDNVLMVSANGVLGNDADIDSASLTVALGANPTNGTVTLAADGSFVYTPNADFAGADSFTYIASDGELPGSETTVTITVTPVNDKPIAEDDAYVTDENQALQISAPGVLANDGDLDDDALTASVITGPTNGTLTMAEDGSFLYTPNAGFAGTDTFTYAAEDGAEAATAVVTITVNDVVQPPLTHGDAYNVAEDMALDISAAWGVLANDFDPQGLAMTAEVVTPPEHGELTLNSDGSFSYVPDANFFGNDSFTYRAINASGEMSEGTASIVVQTVNDAPTAGDDSFTVAAGGVVQTTAATGVMTNDADIENGPLTATLLNGPAHGSIEFSADGSFTYTPAADYTGGDEFLYQLNDGIANSNVARATIAIMPAIESENTRPTAVNDAFTLPADAPLTVAANGVLANDTDAQGDALLASLFAGPQHGTLALNADGSFTYSPEAGYVGTDSFLYRVNDGALSSALAAVTLRIEANPEAALSPDADAGDGMLTVGEDPANDCVLTDWA